MPSFGRPIGESTAVNTSGMTTAARAVALHNEILEGKKSRPGEDVIQSMADNFFISRMRRPDELSAPSLELPGTLEPTPSTGAPPMGAVPAAARKGGMPTESATAPKEKDLTKLNEEEKQFTPRGSFVDVQA
jgi:hypothetical protein